MTLLTGLNPAQAKAVQLLGKPVLVLAGPGSGKTRVLTHRVAYLVKQCGIDPYHIIAVTFTNKAAREMRDRLEKLIGEQSLHRLTIGTFHANCARILRREAETIGLRASFVIYDREDQISLIRQAIKELNLDDKMYRPQAIQAAISNAKRALLTPEEYAPPTYWHEGAGRVYRRYRDLLRANGALDFDDLLMLTVRVLTEREDIRARYQKRYEHVLVDEFQDTDGAQYQLVSLLGGGRRNLFVVGDEDQSIYGWRGADFRNVERFRKDYPDAEVVLLEQNYRSTRNILDASRHVIARNVHRHPKGLWTENQAGQPITVFEAYDEQEEAEYIVREIERLTADGVCSLGDCAVMYRTNAQSRVLEDAFMRHGLAYKLVGATRFYERREVKDILAYLRIIQSPYDDVSLKRIINVPARGIGKKTIDELEQWAQSQSLPLYTALQVLRDEQHGQSLSASAAAQLTIGGKSLKALVSFTQLVNTFIETRKQASMTELLDKVIEDTGYAQFVRDGTEEGEDRWDNLQELRSVASEYNSMPPGVALVSFLEDVALVSEVDNLRDESTAATLLTLHTAKGLEFDTVFMVGMEEGILPHSRSIDEPDEMEEERRLCYVGMTRAKRHLHLIHTFRRTRFGSQELSQPSRFLQDIPPSLIKGKEVRAPTRHRVQAGFSGGASAGNHRSETSRSRFAPGDRVRHSEFGDGIVVSSQNRRGDEEVLVAFNGKAGIKRLMASFAGLELLSRPR